MNGRQYALNGIARQAGFPDTRPLQKLDVTAGAPGIRMSTDVLRERAMTLCR